MSDIFTYNKDDYNQVTKLLVDGNLDGLKQMEEKGVEDFQQCTKTWNMLEEMKNIEQFDTDDAWSKLHNRLDEDKLLPEEKSKLISMNRILSIAASLVVILGLSFLIQQYLNTSDFIVENNNTEAKSISLPDGSIVYLNKDASLKYTEDFNQELREVELKGEAFFDIKRNVEKPFVVNVNDAQVTVLGTSFNVKPEANKELEVIVRSGKVKVCNCTNSGENIILTKGEKGILQGTKLSKKVNSNINYLAWMNKKLSFKSIPLEQVVKDLNASYHANIQIVDKDINNMLITTTFDSLTINEILESLALTLDIKIEYEGKKAILVKP